MNIQMLGKHLSVMVAEASIDQAQLELPCHCVLWTRRHNLKEQLFLPPSLDASLN